MGLHAIRWVVLHGLTRSVTFAEWLPDLGQFQTDGIYEVPADLLSYGPIKPVSLMQCAGVTVAVAAVYLKT